MPDETNGLLLAGDLYIDRLEADGTSTGFMPVSNATQMALQQEMEFKDLISRKKDTYGQLLATVPIPSPGEINLTLDEINRQNLAIALLGDLEEVNDAAGTVTDEAVTLKGMNWTELEHRNLASEGLTVSHNSSDLTKDTDFEVNYALGLIRALSGGSLSGGEDLTVSYEHNAVSGQRVKGAVRPLVRARLMLHGRNMVDDRPVIAIVDEATLRPTEAVDLLSEEFVTLPMTGRMRTLPGKDNPFSVELQDAA